jgi:multidrug efflux pump subunit AcrB
MLSSARNAILLVGYAVMAMRERGLALHDALLEACHKRARPIGMTRAAMGWPACCLLRGGSVRMPALGRPMALAAMGGLINSTALSLVVVPAVFSYVHAFGQLVL